MNQSQGKQVTARSILASEISKTRRMLRRWICRFGE
jgi:hypothetical protein